MLSESVGKNDGIWIDLDRPLCESPAANLLDCKPHVAEERRISCCVVNAAGHWCILEVLRPHRTFRTISNPATSLSCKHVKLIASENSNAAICADLCPQDGSLVRRESYNREAVQRWVSPLPGRTRTKLVTCPGLLVLVISMDPWLAASDASCPSLVFVVALLSSVSTAHCLVAIVTLLATIRFHPVCHVFDRGFGWCHPWSSTPQSSTVPNICVFILQEGAVDALWHTHCPTSCLQETLVPRVFAAFCMVAICVFCGAPLCHPWRCRSSSVRTRSAHPNCCTIPRIIV